MDLDLVLPGHMLKADMGKLTGTVALEHTYNYINDYEQAIQSSESANELIAKMKQKYPNMQHQSALYMGTFINFREMHLLTWNPTIEKIFEFLPDSLADWINEIFYQSAKKKYNH